MKTISALKPKEAPTDMLRYHLHKLLARKEPARSTLNVHASDLTKEDYQFCARERAIIDVTKKKRPDEFLSTAMQVTFKIGRDLQVYVVDCFSELEQAVGNWVCVSCETNHSFQKKPAGCKTCKGKVFRQEEYRFKSAISGASCGIDMLWNNNAPAHTIVEIKSIDKEKFKELQAPLAEHRLRTNLYMRIVAESDDPLKSRVRQDRAKILYISKGGYGVATEEVVKWGIADHKFSPFKEFWVDRDDKQTDSIVAPAIRFQEFRKGLKGMPEGLCKTSYGQRAMKCSCLKECFSGQFPAQD